MDGNYYYYRKDHLGNNCEVWNATQGETVQTMDYYPSGLPLYTAGAFDSEDNPIKYNTKKYNGKEFIEMIGYDCYAYGFRDYYPVIGRFTAMDPLAETNYSVSPYAYANNNFVNNIDVMGLSAYTTTDPDEIAALMRSLGNGGSVNDYDFSNWDDISDDPYAIANAINQCYLNGGGGSKGMGMVKGKDDFETLYEWFVYMVENWSNNSTNGKGGLFGAPLYIKATEGEKLNMTQADIEELLNNLEEYRQGENEHTCQTRCMSFANMVFGGSKKRNDMFYREKYNTLTFWNRFSVDIDNFRGVNKKQEEKFLNKYFNIIGKDVVLKDAINRGSLVFEMMITTNGYHTIVVVGYQDYGKSIIFYDPDYGGLYVLQISYFTNHYYERTNYETTGIK